MSVKEKIKDDIAVLTISGKLMGGSETWDIHEKVKAQLENNIKKFVLDLSKVKWMNSQGLGVLMACFTSISNASGQMKVSGATAKVNSLFMITKMITVFDVYETVDEAVAGF